MTTTYIPLATTTLASATNTVTFSSISSSYTDLVLVINYQASGGAVYAQYRLNGDSGSNYRRNVISGNGSTAGNYNSGSESYMYAANTIYAGSGQWATLISNFNNYSNTTTNKTAIHRFSEATIGTEATISSWNSTAAINSITINTNGNNFGIGSTFSLYGIASAAISGAKATGGDIVATDGTYWYHAFRGSGTFTPTSTLSCDVFVVAGGGSGGADSSGGGGAGGVIAFAAQSLASGTGYTATIGAGGAGRSSSTDQGNNGSNSQFSSLTAAVGGGTGGGGAAGGGTTGGSGGGSRIRNNAGTSGQGNQGGSGINSGAYQAGGGGGAGGAGGAGGTSGATNVGGAGGAGTNSVTNWGALSSMLTATGLGVSGYIAGGGGGGIADNAGAGGAAGSGGATAGTRNNEGISGNATANTGSGSGGGGGNPSGFSGNGGSGLVIVRYPI